MASVFSAIFSPSDPQGPDPELLAAQQRQEARLLEKEQKEQKKLDARKKVIKAQQGGSIATLFAGTGELGVRDKLGA